MLKVLSTQGISAEREREDMGIIKVKKSRKIKHLSSQQLDIKELSNTVILVSIALYTAKNSSKVWITPMIEVVLPLVSKTHISDVADLCIL